MGRFWADVSVSMDGVGSMRTGMSKFPSNEVMDFVQKETLTSKVEEQEKH